MDNHKNNEIENLKQQMDDARRRKAAAEAAEQERLAEEARHQREAAEAEAVIRHAEGKYKAHLLAEEAHALQTRANELQEQISEINARLSELLSAVTGAGEQFVLSAVLESFGSYHQNRLEYAQFYTNLHRSLMQTRNQYPDADFSEVDNALFVLPRPNIFADKSVLLDRWLGDNTRKDFMGRPTSTPPEVDAVCALVAALLDQKGRSGIKKFFHL